jgi:hypothetical protein
MEMTLDKLKQMSGPGRIVSANKDALATMQDGIRWAAEEIERKDSSFRSMLQWAVQEIEQKDAEIANLKELRLHRMEVENGAMNFSLSGEPGKAFVTFLVRFFEDNGGKNFLSFDISKSDHHYSISIQKVSGELTPVMKMNQQAEEIKRLREALEDIETLACMNKWNAIESIEERANEALKGSP